MQRNTILVIMIYFKLSALIFTITFLFTGCKSNNTHQDKGGGNTISTTLKSDSITFTRMEISGIGYEEGIIRRDPSDVIKVEDTFYVYYTRVILSESPEHLGSSGYPGRIWCAFSTDEGKNWTEKGEVLGLGEHGNFDSYGVFTPNILYANGKYYLYYTGVQPTPGKKIFENNAVNDYTAIGLAVSDFPDSQFVRVENNPVLKVGAASEELNKTPSKFDSYRVDDASIVVRGDHYCLYYKGRNMDYGPGQTKMGVAIADQPEGPYTKLNQGNPVQKEGHEVMVWKMGEGVLSIVSNVGRGIYYSKDGLNFAKTANDFIGKIKAPGAFREDLTNHGYNEGAQWGISHNKKDKLLFLERWEISNYR